MHNRNNGLTSNSLTKESMIKEIITCLTTARKHKVSYKNALLKLAKKKHARNSYEEFQEYLETQYQLTLYNFKATNRNHYGYSLVDTVTQERYFCTNTDGKEQFKITTESPSNSNKTPSHEQFVSELSFSSSSSETTVTKSSAKLTKKEMIDNISSDLLSMKLSSMTTEKKISRVARKLGFSTISEFTHHLKSEYHLLLEKTHKPYGHSYSYSYSLIDDITKQKYFSTKDCVLLANDNSKNLKDFKFISHFDSQSDKKRKQSTSTDERPPKKAKTTQDDGQSSADRTIMPSISWSLFSQTITTPNKPEHALTEQNTVSRDKLIEDFISFSEQCKLLAFDYHKELKKFVSGKYQLDAPSYIALLSKHNLSLKITDSAAGKDVVLRSLHDNSIIRMYSLVQVAKDQQMNWQLCDFRIEPQAKENTTDNSGEFDSNNISLFFDNQISDITHSPFALVEENTNQPLVFDFTNTEKNDYDEDFRFTL